MNPEPVTPDGDALVQEVTDQLATLSIRKPTDDEAVAGAAVDLAADLALVQGLHERLQQRLSGIGS